MIKQLDDLTEKCNKFIKCIGLGNILTEVIIVFYCFIFLSIMSLFRRHLQINDS